MPGIDVKIYILGLAWLAAGGCAASPVPMDGPAGSADAPHSIDGPGNTSGMPAAGAHALAFLRVGESAATSISTPAVTTQAAGSTIVVSVGRGNKLLFDGAAALPTDTKKNGSYPQLGETEAYVHPNEFSGTALYALPSAKGGAGFQVNTIAGMSTDGNHDEVTIAAVEVIGGTRIQDFEWNEVVQGADAVPVTSNSVTTTGPATLVAFWWGDGLEPDGGQITVENGFQIVDSILEGGSLVQCAVAVKNVTAPGTYDVTWTAMPLQGAQLWLVAVE